MSLTHEVLGKWLYFFQQNADYQEYSKAKQSGDVAACLQFEGKFERISELYADWGDISTIGNDADSASFKHWLARRRHLFFQDESIQWVANSNNYEHIAGHLLLDIPLLESKEKTLEAFQLYIARVYKYLGQEHQTRRSPLTKVVTQLLPPPKYSLHGEFNTATQGRLQKALFTRYCLDQKIILKDGQLYTHFLSTSEIVDYAKRYPENPFGWTSTEDDIKARKNGKLVKTVLVDAERVQIKRSIKDFEGYVRNTVYGRFPDNR